jgi:hypothetical protein
LDQLNRNCFLLDVVALATLSGETFALAGLTAEGAVFFADDFAAGAGDLAACFFRAAIADAHAV